MNLKESRGNFEGVGWGPGGLEYSTHVRNTKNKIEKYRRCN